MEALTEGTLQGQQSQEKALETINQPELLNNVLSRGKQLMQGLNELNKRHKLFKTIRGQGLLIGAVLKDDYGSVE